MKNINRYLIQFMILIIFTVLSACKKDKPITYNLISEESTCEDFPEFMMSWFAEERFQYKSPCFNPKNVNEFIYYYKDNELNIYQLVKYNLQTEQKTVLVNDIKIHGQLKWSNKGSIAFTRVNGYVDHIFIVQDNGDSLTQITTITANLNPFWNDDGRELYWTHSPDLGAQWFLLSRRENLLIIDTVSDIGGFNNVDILNDKLIHIRNIETGGFSGNPTYYGFHILSSPPYNKNNFTIIRNSFKGPIGGINWNPSGLSFYVSHTHGNDRGLYEINLNGFSKQLIKHCDNMHYSIISCSSDGKSLIAERVDSFLEYDNENQPTGKIIQNSSIWMIDTETLNETKIELD